ncbi:hypothetical protein VB005_11353 [Metarhizium brunneum]
MVADQKPKLLTIKFPATWNAGAGWVLPFILRHQDVGRRGACATRERLWRFCSTGFVSSQDLDFSLMPPGSYQLCHALRTISWNSERVENTSATQKPGRHLRSNWARFVFAGSYAGSYAVDQPFVILGFWERHKNYTEGAPLSHRMSINLQPMVVTRVARPPPLTYKSWCKLNKLA